MLSALGVTFSVVFGVVVFALLVWCFEFWVLGFYRFAFVFVMEVWGCNCRCGILCLWGLDWFGLKFCVVLFCR